MVRSSPGAAACCACLKKQNLCQGIGQGDARNPVEEQGLLIQAGVIVGDVHVHTIHPTAPTTHSEFQQSLKLHSSSGKGFQNQDHLVKAHYHNDNRNKCYK